MSHPPLPEPLYIPAGADLVLASLHRPAPGASGAGVLLCPPFGWEEVCSYRPLRHWGQRLAESGHTALRLSYPGTGDSGGSPRDPARLAAWVAAVTAAASRLRADGCSRVVAVGIELGGLVACLAAAEGAPIDDLALWAVPARGRGLTRAWRAFSKMESAGFYEGLGDPPPAPEGELDAGGFVLTNETLEAVGAIDLRELELPGAAGRRALLLGRDGLAVDAALSRRLEEIGVEVTTGTGEGYAAMTSHPQGSAAPLEVMERTQAWLAQAAAAPALAAAAFAAPSPETVAPGVRETVLSFDSHRGRMAGVLAQPAGGEAARTCVVLLNAGAVRRIGPSRMWVEAARRWAARGVPVLRLDVEGIGDAEGDDGPLLDDGAFYTPAFVPQVLRALDDLAARGVADRFVLGGLCSGAYWSFHAALQDDRVTGLLLLNSRVLIWSEDLDPGRDLRALLTQRPSLSKLRRVATGARLRSFLRWAAGTPLRLVRRLASGESGGDGVQRRIDEALDRLMASGTRCMLLFAENEALLDELQRSGRLERLLASPYVMLERVRVRDHTMRPGWAQREVHQALDRALERMPGIEADAATDAAAATSGSGAVNQP